MMGYLMHILRRPNTVLSYETLIPIFDFLFLQGASPLESENSY